MSGDLRAAVEGLRQPNATTFVDAACNSVVDRVLALIPEGAVLVTEEHIGEIHWLLVNEVNRTDEAYLQLLDALEPLVTHSASERADAMYAEDSDGRD